jgi:hypothetical protein
MASGVAGTRGGRGGGGCVPVYLANNDNEMIDLGFSSRKQANPLYFCCSTSEQQKSGIFRLHAACLLRIEMRAASVQSSSVRPGGRATLARYLASST